jgi:hypothetical protein
VPSESKQRLPPPSREQRHVHHHTKPDKDQHHHQDQDQDHGSTLEVGAQGEEVQPVTQLKDNKSAAAPCPHPDCPLPQMLCKEPAHSRQC